jgi:hypothetical protein
MTYRAVFDGFETKEKALAFIRWFEGEGEQFFYDHLDMTDQPKESSTVCMTHEGNSGSYWDETDMDVIVQLR